MISQDLSEAQLTFEVDGLAADQLLVVRYHGTEALAQVYRFEVELASMESELYFDDIVGRPAKLTVQTAHGERWFHGIVSRFELTGEANDQRYFRADLVPAVWVLTQRYDSRIFQDMSVPEIVAEVLGQAGIGADGQRMDLQNDYPPREYCVQYRETDYTFIARLMERAGIWWHFEQSADGHVMVCADSPVAYAPIDEGSELPYVPPAGLEEAAEHVAAFRMGQSVRPGAVALNDFNFENPKLGLQTAADLDGDIKLEHSDYPGSYASQAEGNECAQRRIEELETGRVLGRGEGNCHRLAPGRTFALTEHACESLNSTYLLTSVTHEGRQSTSRTATGPNGVLLTGHEGRLPEVPLYHAGRLARELFPETGTPEADKPGDFEQPAYRCRFECIPASVSYRPARVTPWPDVRGAQTARVVGPDSEEIYTDEYGRVKVQFNWDRRQGFDENASCWIRVSQGMSGGQYGIMFLPRVGQEVVIDFLEGDPDRPFVVGRVYNADHMPPYPLPDEKTKSVIKTHSSKGGGGSNEIRFEDLKDNEQLFIQAQKDLHLRVKNDRVENVENDHHLTVAQSKYALVKQNEHSEVKLDLKQKVGGSKYLEVAGDVGEQFNGNHCEQVGNRYYLNAASDLVIESGAAVTLKVGGNFIKVDATGIYVMGTVVHLNSEGSAGNGTPVALKSPDAPIEADTAAPGSDTTYAPQSSEPTAAEALASSGAADNSSSEKETSWIEIELVDEAGQPWPHERYEIIEPDGTLKTGSLDENGQAYVSVSDPGECQISFPNLDRRAWERA